MLNEYINNKTKRRAVERELEIIGEIGRFVRADYSRIQKHAAISGLMANLK